MSTRQILNITLGAVVVLSLTFFGIVLLTMGKQGVETVQVELAQHQQQLVRELTRDTSDLATAESLLDVNQVRTRMGRNIVQFDQGLASLLHGGTVDNAQGKSVTLPRVNGQHARLALENCASLWIETGMPLADLAAGEFSVFSAAGQQAIQGLQTSNEDLIAYMESAGIAFQQQAKSQNQRAKFFRWTAFFLTGMALVLGVTRFRMGKDQTPTKRSATPARPLAAKADEVATPVSEAAPVGEPLPVRPRDPHQRYTSPVDFDNVNATVDQMSVDMNTIAGSTDKMRHAIDSVGHALQGMLYSLNEMSQDTAEGYKIVRNANNAASYTADTAGELAESAREMSRVVARVSQLAMKTRQVAGQIDAEAVHTGQTGEAFTSVVASEVKGLAQQTSTATSEIEQTVAEILGTARQYEEAIGQIIKNISNINKVSQNLGELMLHPPTTVVPGTPLAAPQPQVMAPAPSQPAQAQAQPPAPQAAAPAPAAAPTPEPATAPVAETPAPTADAAPEPAPEPTPEPTPAPAPVPPSVPEEEPWGGISDDPAAAETSSAIEDAADTSEGQGDNGNVFILGRKTPPKDKIKLDPDAAAEATANEPVAEAAPEEDSNANVFMLNKPKKADATPAPEPAAPAAEAPAPAPEPEPEPAAPAVEAPAAEEEDSGSNIFMLNKPSKADAAAAPAPEPAPEPAAPTAEAPVAEEEEEEDSGSNVFMLNKPKKGGTKEEAPAPAPATEEPAAEVTVPADDEEEDAGKKNVFMLNSPKK